MGVITKEVEKLITGKNIKWYQDKGYNCKLNEKIIIKIEDLSNGSHDRIETQCDKCGVITQTNYCKIVSKQGLYENTYCVKCANDIKNDNRGLQYVAKDGVKLCKKCKRILPADIDHYFIKNDTKDGFMSQCKECCGKKFTDHLTHIPKDGYKFCNRCGKELESNSKYFEKIMGNKDGLSCVCRVCQGSYYREEETYRPDNWTDEDIELLKMVYSYYTGEELVKHFFLNRTIRALESMADILNISGKTQETYKRSLIQRGIKISNKTKGKKMSCETRIKLSKSLREYYKTHDGNRLGVKASDEARIKMSQAVKARAYWVGDKNPRHLNPLSGSLNPRWQGGITSFYQELRSETKEWFNNSINICNYKCVLTNTDFNNVHHLTSFRDIVKETFILCNLDIRQQVGDYTEDEFTCVRNTLKDLHIKYGYGVALCKPIHKLFHDNYGYYNNTPQQFFDFVNELHNNVYEDWLNKNNIKLNINWKIINEIKALLDKTESA